MTTLERIHARLGKALAPPHSRLVPFVVDGMVVGRVTADRAARLAEFRETFTVGEAIEFTSMLTTPQARTAAVADVATQLEAEGALTAWRDERYDVSHLFELERAAARYFGVHTYAAHVNGLVRNADGIAMWLARRSATKSIDPGKLDNLVGGGIAVGMAIADTVVKEAWEEAGIPRDIAATAHLMGEVTVLREQHDGIQHETVYIHDLWLDEAFVPQNQDGEAVEHRLVAIDDVAAVLATDEMTIDATLVALQCLSRLRHDSFATIYDFGDSR